MTESDTSLLVVPFKQKVLEFWNDHRTILDDTDLDGHTAFSRAADVDDIHTCQLLLDCGSKPSLSAAEYGHSKVFDMLDGTETNLRHRGKKNVGYIKSHVLMEEGEESPGCCRSSDARC